MLRMNRVFLLIFFASTFGICSSQDYEAETTKAVQTYDKKQYDSCSFYFEKAFKIKMTSGNDLYNAAVCNTLNLDYKRALGLLSKAIERGANISKLKIDPDLEPLHSSVKWKKLLQQAN